MINKLKKHPFVVFLLGCFLLLGVFQVNNSSVGMYGKLMYGENYHDPALLAGTPRGIRWDEWFVTLPVIMSQARQGFPRENKAIGLSQDLPVLTTVPYYHWKVLFHPQDWWFFFLPFDHALALYSWSGPFLMLLALYWMGLKIFHQKVASVLFSLSYFFSPFNQWWSYGMSYFVGFGLLSFLFFWRLLESRGNYFWHNLILSCYFFWAFLFIVYPPFQISIGYWLLFLGIGLVLNKKWVWPNWSRYRLWGVFVCVIGLTLGLIYWFRHDFWETYLILANTVYPGQRLETGSGFALPHLLNGFFSMNLLSDYKSSGFYLNQSEASSFLFSFLFAWPAVVSIVWQMLRRRKWDGVYLMGVSFAFVTLLWLFVSWPKWLAVGSLLYLVPPPRIVIGLGAVSYFLLFYQLYVLKLRPSKISAWLSVVFTFGMHLSLGFFYKEQYPQFLQSSFKIVVISILASSLTWLLVFGYRRLFTIFFVLYSFCCTALVNPLYRGTTVLTNAPLFKEIERVNDQYPHLRWAVFGNWHGNRLVLAAGGRVLNGIHFYPQFKLWLLLDKHRKHQYIYNRYANIVFLDKQNGPAELIRGTDRDNFFVRLSPCDSFLNKTEARLLLFPANTKASCLKKISDRFPIYLKTVNSD